VKQVAPTVRRAAGGALTAVPMVVAGTSWHALAALGLAMLIVVAAVCWAIADSGRTRRLAALIRAWRGTTARPAVRARPARSATPEGPRTHGDHDRQLPDGREFPVPNLQSG
jgi:hypothetical protein